MGTYEGTGLWSPLWGTEEDGLKLWGGILMRLIAVMSFNAAGESSPSHPSGKSTQLQELLLRMGSACECVEHYSIHTRCLLPQGRLISLNFPSNFPHLSPPVFQGR